MAKHKVTNRIKHYLGVQGLTQGWLAGKLEMDYRTVNRYCNNHIQPSFEKLYKIAKLLKVHVKDLIEE